MIDRQPQPEFHLQRQVAIPVFTPATRWPRRCLANDVRLDGSRSFKYHRPRGVFTAGSEEPNALVELRSAAYRQEPNTRATVAELFEGLDASQPEPCLAVAELRSALAVNDLMSPFFAAGFYYKTFMWPKAALWEKLYEPMIRRAAGLGRACRCRPDPGQLMTRASCVLRPAGHRRPDAAGLAAALTAGADRRTGDPGRRGLTGLGGRLLAESAPLRPAGRSECGLGRGRPSPNSPACRTCAFMRRTTRSGAPSTMAAYGAVERVSRPPRRAPRPSGCANRLWRITAKQRDPGRRRDRASHPLSPTTTGPG